MHERDFNESLRKKKLDLMIQIFLFQGASNCVSYLNVLYHYSKSNTKMYFLCRILIEDTNSFFFLFNEIKVVNLPVSCSLDILVSYSAI